MKMFGYVLLLFALAAAPASQPSSPRTNADGSRANALEADMATAHALVRKLTEQRLKALKQSNSYTAALVDLNTKKAIVDELELKQDASVEHKNAAKISVAIARLKTRQMEQDAVTQDAEISEAQKSFDEIKSSIAAASRDTARLLSIEQEERRLAAIPLISITELKANGGKFYGQKVKIRCEFYDTDDTSPLALLHVADPADVFPTRSGGRYIPRGLPPDFDKAPFGEWELPAWLGIEVVSQGRLELRRFFALRAGLGDAIGKLKRDQPVTLYGTVNALKQDGTYGIVVEKIVPE